MKQKNIMKIFSLILGFILIFSYLNVGNIEAKTNLSKSYLSERISGNTRMDTARAIAGEYNNGMVNDVIFSTAEDFPDALAGGVLAAKFNAPILLVGANVSDSSQAFDFVKKHLNKGGTVHVLGGEGVISSSITDYIKQLGFVADRIGGQCREDTCKLISEKISPAKGTPVVLAIYDDFPDALSISSIAGIKGYPILLTYKNSLPKQTVEVLKNINPSKVYIAGGNGVISDDIKTEISSTIDIPLDSLVRLSGKDRYETSVAIAKYFNLDTENALISTGLDFPDALAGSILGVKLKAPIILLDNNNFSKQKEYINSTKIVKYFVLGGRGAVSNNTVTVLSNDFLDGNSAGNMMNGSFAANDDEYIYYSAGGLCKIKLDDTKESKIEDGLASNININGDYIYYSKLVDDPGIYKMKKDGSCNVKINNSCSYYMQSEDDWIYFTKNINDTDLSELWKVRSDGTGEVKIPIGVNDSYNVENGYAFVVKNGWIYLNVYSKSEPVTSALVRVKVDGSSCNVISETEQCRFIPVDNYLYYSNSEGIFKINVDGTNNVLLNGDKYKNGHISSINISGGYIYYGIINSDYNECVDEGIYKIKLDGTDKVKLTNSEARYLCVVEDWIYFDGGNSLSKIKIDGTNLQHVH